MPIGQRHEGVKSGFDHSVVSGGYPSTPMTRTTGSRLAHPLLIYGGTWTIVFFLYSLGLSGQLIYEADEFYYLYFCILGAFLAGFCYMGAVIAAVKGYRPQKETRASFQPNQLSMIEESVFWRRTATLLKVWAALTLIEIVVSGGIPIIWLFTGNGKTYADFGIHSFHGLLMSLLMACSIISSYLFLETKKRKFIVVPLCAIAWFVVSITRAYIVGIIFQTLFLFLTVRRAKVSQISKIALGMLFLILAFGFIGDLRSGGDELIRALGRPTERYPDWLPTGFLWVYVYLATPLNNLFNEISLNPSIDGFSIAVTTSQLFPTLLRDIIFPANSLQQSALVDSSLNISTGLIGPYVDMGLAGIILFTCFLGAVANLFWSLRRERFFCVGYSFVAQALFISIFYESLLYLPNLFQLVWFWYILRPVSAAKHIQPILGGNAPSAILSKLPGVP
jgi:oligosaccharide repeat unit polymerase